MRTEVSIVIPGKGHSTPVLYENFEQQSVINHILCRDCSFHGRLRPDGRSEMTSKVFQSEAQRESPEKLSIDAGVAGQSQPH